MEKMQAIKPTLTVPDSDSAERRLIRVTHLKDAHLDDEMIDQRDVMVVNGITARGEKMTDISMDLVPEGCTGYRRYNFTITVEAEPV